MLYIKEKDKKIDLARVPVFTTCPRCGVEHEIDLVRVIKDIEHSDLYGTAVYCKECTAVQSCLSGKRRK